MTLGPSIFHLEVDAVDIAVSAHPFEKTDGVPGRLHVRATCQETDPPRPLIQCLAERRNRQRPRRRRAAEQRDELAAAAHSITSSARARSIGGSFSASAFAVRAFTTSSNFDGCSTGRSPGLTPCRIFLTWLAARRYRS